MWNFASQVLIEVSVFILGRKSAKNPRYNSYHIAKMFILVPDLLRSHFSIHHKVFQINSVIFLLCLNACLKFSVVIAGPTTQQEQELLLLEALSKRQPSYYGTSNSLMDILGRSMFKSMHNFDEKIDPKSKIDPCEKMWLFLVHLRKKSDCLDVIFFINWSVLTLNKVLWM